MALIDVFIQPTSAAGVPLAGGLMYIYAAGTTTPVTTYQDSVFATPTASPVVADASGIFAPTYIKPAASPYKLVFKTSASVTVLTVDNIAVPTDLTTADQPVTGGALITSLDLGTKSTGTLTPDPGARPIQRYINGGAHTLAPGSSYGHYILDITNNGSAGAVTTSGWTKVVGAFDTTNAHKFRCFCSVSELGSLLSIQNMF